MWYLIHMDDGIVEQASTKREIMLSHSKCYRYGISLGKALYHVMDEEHEYYLFSSREQAIDSGFEWAFDDIES